MPDEIWYREYLAVAAQLDAMTAERDALREALEKMDGDARWTISDVEHDLTDMRLRAEAAEAERDELRAELAATRDKAAYWGRLARKHGYDAERLRAELAAEREKTGVSLTVGGGLQVYGKMDAIHRVQQYILLDSRHPVESADVRRSLARALQTAEAERDALRAALIEWLDWWELPRGAKRPDVAELIYNRACDALKGDDRD